MIRAISFYEFFAGAGMARAGLGEQWTCVFSNELDAKKSQIYRKNWKTPDVLKVADVSTLKTSDVPTTADLAWASFPCQDLSLAGAGAGLKGDRSGTFWPFWRLMEGLIAEGRAPKMIVLENVCGTLTSHNGKDFAAICATFVKAGYQIGAMVIDAVHFVPQSRPRLFVIGICDNMPVAARKITTDCGSTLWHPRGLLNAYEKLPRIVKDKWLWWSPAPPPLRTVKFSDLIEDDPCDVEWHSGSETEKLLRMMSTINRDKLNEAKAWRMPIVGAVYKRTRQDEGGRKLQRAEIRFDGIAGCLRTPAGGSSRQLIMIVDGQSVRSRLISARETARLMGLPDSYELPGNYNEAYHLTGDGVVVPVVRYLAQNIFEPLLAQRHVRSREAA